VQGKRILAVLLLAIAFSQVEAKAENVKSEKVSQDCIDINVISQLARIGEYDSESVAMIRQLKFSACGLGSNRGSFANYPNGITAKFGSSWNYPNGITAKFGSSWNYPNGITAKFGSSWNYPNGITAGAINNLITYACGKLDDDYCNNRLSDFQLMDTLFQDLKAIELAWFAYKTEQNQQKRN
jgi:hypothetical protein